MGESGSVTVWMVLTPLLVLLLGGMSLDLWAALSARGRIAAIADDAAIAGATAVAVTELRDDLGDQAPVLDPHHAQARALAAVDAHPQSGLVTGRSVSASPDIVTVTVEGQYQFLLLRMVGATTAPISVTGSARPQTAS